MCVDSREAFRKAFKLLKESQESCKQLIIFITDADPGDGSIRCSKGIL